MIKSKYKRYSRSIEEEKIAILYGICAILCFGFEFETAALCFTGVSLANVFTAIRVAWLEIKEERGISS